jgi:hypothetical protein
MVKKSDLIVVPDEAVMNKIYVIRNQKIMLDKDLADLFQVETKVLKQSVKRNMDIFPEHFMFELTEKRIRSFEVTICDLKRRARRHPLFTHGIQ